MAWVHPRRRIVIELKGASAASRTMPMRRWPLPNRCFTAAVAPARPSETAESTPRPRTVRSNRTIGVPAAEASARWSPSLLLAGATTSPSTRFARRESRARRSLATFSSELATISV